MFANCQKGGTNMAAPDVCKTPVGPSVVPIPYPNTASGATANPATAAKKVLISGAPGHTLQTTIPMSNGDNAGVAGGVLSGMIMGALRFLMGASNVMFGGSPATKMTDTTGQNGSSLNTQGLTCAPAQTKVMIMQSSGGSNAASTSQSANTPPGVTTTFRSASTPAAANEETSPTSDEVAVRIGVFFDGTGNNKENDKKFAKRKGTDTNVARLFDLYQTNEAGKEVVTPIGKLNGLDLFTHKIYVNGVGTENNREEPDDMEMATGAGAVTRISDALRRLRTILTHFSDKEGPRIVDVFGFSRGASSARDFINQVNRNLSSDGVEVGLVGIFDTVDSFGVAGHDCNYRRDSPLLGELNSNPYLVWANQFKLDLGTSSAKHIVHLTAKDEKRVNFPLNSLKSAKNAPLPANMKEVEVVGVHADVGGGYGWSPMEETDLIEKEQVTYFPGSASEEARALKKRNDLKARAEKEGLVVLPAGKYYSRGGTTSEFYWLAKRRTVKPGLSNVYLHWMYKKAKAADLPLFEIAKFVSDEPRRFGIPTELQALFQSDLETCTNPKKVRSEYVHASHRDWEDGNSEGRWIANRADDEREIFYNKPGKAVVPVQEQATQSRAAQ
jgi:hypothetical protein